MSSKKQPLVDRLCRANLLNKAFGEICRESNVLRDELDSEAAARAFSHIELAKTFFNRVLYSYKAALTLRQKDDPSELDELSTHLSNLLLTINQEIVLNLERSTPANFQQCRSAACKIYEELYKSAAAHEKTLQPVYAKLEKQLVSLQFSDTVKFGIVALISLLAAGGGVAAWKGVFKQGETIKPTIHVDTFLTTATNSGTKINEVAVLGLHESRPLKEAQVRLSVSGGRFVANGGTYLTGSTDNNGFFKTGWICDRVHGEWYTLSIDVAKDGFVPESRIVQTQFCP